MAGSVCTQLACRAVLPWYYRLNVPLQPSPYAFNADPCRQLREKLEQHEARRTKAAESYTSLQNEVDVKTAKLSKLWNKLQRTKKEIEAIHEDFAGARDNVQVRSTRLRETMFHLNMEMRHRAVDRKPQGLNSNLTTLFFPSPFPFFLKMLTEEVQRAVLLKTKIIEHFIPPDVAEKLRQRAVFDEESSEWRLLSVTHSEVSSRLKFLLSLQGAHFDIFFFARIRCPDVLLVLG